MTLEQYRKDKKLSYYVFGQMLGLHGQDPEMVKKILEVTKNKVTIKDLYESWWEKKV